jgi:hypothetical protein
MLSIANKDIKICVRSFARRVCRAGNLEVEGAGTVVDPFNNGFIYGSAAGSGTADIFGGGSAAGFNALGEAGGLASGVSEGDADGSTTTVEDGQGLIGSGLGTATGTFNNVGSGSFGGNPTSVTFP